MQRLREWIRDEIPGGAEERKICFPLALLAVIIQLFSYIRYYSSRSLEKGLVGDPLTFQLTGWYLMRGGRLYIDVWEPKPPLAFMTTAFLALLSFGDMAVLHILGFAASLLAITGIVVLTGLLTHALTGDIRAAVVAGAVPFVLPAFHSTANRGFHDKYFVVFTGLLALYLAIKKRPASSGGAAAAAVGYVQLGAIYPLLAILIIYNRLGRRQVGRFLGGFVSIGMVVLAPVIIWGALNQMVAQTILLPLLNEGGDQSLVTLISQSYRIAVDFGYGVFVALAGAYGLRFIVSRYRSGWWVPAGGLLTVLAVLLIEFDGPNDLFMGLGFLAVSAGVLTASVRPRARQVVSGAVFAIVIISVVFQGGFGVVFGGGSSIIYQVGAAADSELGADSPAARTGQHSSSDSNRVTRMIAESPRPSRLYWSRSPPDHCWYLLRVSGDLRSWVRYVDRSTEISLSERRPRGPSSRGGRYICHEYDIGRYTGLLLHG